MPPRVSSASLMAVLRKCQRKKTATPHTRRPSSCISAFGQRSPKLQASTEPHTREGAGKTLRWQSMAHFSFKCYFSYLVGSPAPTLGSKSLSSFPSLNPLISPSPKVPVHLSANSWLSQPSSHYIIIPGKAKCGLPMAIYVLNQRRDTSNILVGQKATGRKEWASKSHNSRFPASVLLLSV